MCSEIEEVPPRRSRSRPAGTISILSHLLAKLEHIHSRGIVVGLQQLPARCRLVPARTSHLLIDLSRRQRCDTRKPYRDRLSTSAARAPAIAHASSGVPRGTEKLVRQHFNKGWLYTPISPAYLALESSKHERGEQWEEELRRCAIEGGLDFPVIQMPSGSYKRVFPLVAVACIFVLDFGMSVTCMRFRQRQTRLRLHMFD